MRVWGVIFGFEHNICGMHRGAVGLYLAVTLHDSRILYTAIKIPSNQRLKVAYKAIGIFWKASGC